MLIDLHAKTSRSEDVTAPAEQILRSAQEAGLDAVAVVERLSSARCRETVALGDRLGVPVFIGVEIPSDKGLLLGFVPEIADFYVFETWRQLTEFTTPEAETVIELFDEHGGAVIASRPYDLDIPHNMGDMIFRIEGLSAVEVYNSRVGDMQNDFALEAAGFLSLPTVGGSDPVGGGDNVGNHATYFHDDIRTQADLVKALRGRDYWAVQLGKLDRKRSTRSSDPFARRKQHRRSR